MPVRLSRTALLALAVVLPIGSIMPAQAENPAQSFLYGERNFRNKCRPPFKYAAGACVRHCPAGYQNMGGYCRYRTMRY